MEVDRFSLAVPWKLLPLESAWTNHEASFCDRYALGLCWAVLVGLCLNIYISVAVCVRLAVVVVKEHLGESSVGSHLHQFLMYGCLLADPPSPVMKKRENGGGSFHPRNLFFVSILCSEMCVASTWREVAACTAA